MNDGRLDESIGNGDRLAYLGQKTDSDTDVDDEEYKYLESATWGYASTVFPLLAGTLGPMANTSSIFAMTENWTGQVANTEHKLNIQHPPR